jgi:hypothetical protein
LPVKKKIIHFFHSIALAKRRKPYRFTGIIGKYLHIIAFFLGTLCMNFSFIAASVLFCSGNRANQNHELSEPCQEADSNSIRWTREEDHLLSLLKGIDLSWSVISRIFSNRTQNACEKHYSYIPKRKKLTYKAAFEEIRQLSPDLQIRILNLLIKRKNKVFKRQYRSYHSYYLLVKQLAKQFAGKPIPVPVQISVNQQLPIPLESQFPPAIDAGPPIGDGQPSTDGEYLSDDDEQSFVDGERLPAMEPITKWGCPVCGMDCCPFAPLEEEVLSAE